MTDLSTTLARAVSDPRRALVELDRLECEESLRRFTERGWRHITPHRFVGGWHLDAICEHLEAVTDGDIKRLVINIPPRMTKSSTVSVAWPTWTWAQRRHSPLAGPKVQFLSASYAQSLSVRDSTKSRRLIGSKWYQERWGGRFRLTGDQNAKQRYDNNLGGYRLATSVGGTLTGEGGDVIIVDDPHNTIEIESEAQREEAIMWWDEALSTRLNDMATGAYVLIMQRLYENDLTGHVLSQSRGEWVHLMLPMEYDPRRHCSTRLGFSDPRVEDGELLCPERVSRESVEELKIKLGPFGTAGQLQQSPSPRGGGILKADWWQAWPPHVEELQDPMGRPLKPIAYPPMDFVLVSVDTAMTEKEENDWSACTVWGLWRDKRDMPKIMLMDAWQDRLPIHTLVTRIIETCQKRRADRLLIEAKNNGFSVAQEISRLCRDGEWGTFLEPVKGDKVARAYAAQNAFAAGQVWAPARNRGGNIEFLSWAQMVIEQCSGFPRGQHDDLVDTTTQAIGHLRKTGMLLTSDERRDVLREAARPPGRRKEPLYGVM